MLPIRTASGDPIRVGIFYHADPLGYVPSGIDTFIRSLIKWAPADLHYTVVGASSDLHRRPLGKEIALEFGHSHARFIPIISSDPSAKHSRMPLTLQYIWALRHRLGHEVVKALQVLDFHRIEPAFLFRNDSRPKNIFIHNDMIMARDKNSDMRWRHAPWLYELIEGRIFRGMNRVFAVRQSAVDRYRRTYPALEDRFEFIPTTVDTDIFRPVAAEQQRIQRARLRKQLGLTDAARLMIFVGRLDSQKDPALLLKAFEIVSQNSPEAHLVIIGDGTMRPMVESAVQITRLCGRVSLLGAQPANEIATVLQGADLFVMSSAYEGMPIAVLEALATGVPVVSTDVGELRRVVQDGKNGYISPARTPEALANAMLGALSDLKRISGPPCESAVKPFHPEHVFEAIYNNHRAQAMPDYRRDVTATLAQTGERSAASWR
jgi:glycosyltransferase involved in cell wall biosynthesis